MIELQNDAGDPLSTWESVLIIGGASLAVGSMALALTYLWIIW